MAKLIPESITAKFLKILSSTEFRFIFIGAFNTLFGYSIFVSLSLLLNGDISPVFVLLISSIPSTFVAYILQRKVVWKSTARLLPESLRFLVVTISQLGINAVLLYFLTDILGLGGIFSQTAITIWGIIFAYVSHRFWTFRKPSKSL